MPLSIKSGFDKVIANWGKTRVVDHKTLYREYGLTENLNRLTLGEIILVLSHMPQSFQGIMQRDLWSEKIAPQPVPNEELDLRLVTKPEAAHVIFLHEAIQGGLDPVPALVHYCSWQKHELRLDEVINPNYHFFAIKP